MGRKPLARSPIYRSPGNREYLYTKIGDQWYHAFEGRTNKIPVADVKWEPHSQDLDQEVFSFVEVADGT